jgi:hypothetical protein
MPQPPALDPMLSLTTAARLAYKAAMNREAGEQTLNTVARMIASRFSVFASADRESHANPARIMPDEVFEGDFQRGGDTLNFKDGRPRLTNLCMRRADLEKAIAEIRALYDKPAS